MLAKILDNGSPNHIQQKWSCQQEMEYPERDFSLDATEFGGDLLALHKCEIALKTAFWSARNAQKTNRATQVGHHR